MRYSLKINLSNPVFLGLFFFIFIARYSLSILLENNQSIVNYSMHVFVMGWIGLYVFTKKINLASKSVGLLVLFYIFYLVLSTVLTYDKDFYYATKALVYSCIGGFVFFLTNQVIKDRSTNDLVKCFRYLQVGILITLLAWLLKGDSVYTSIVVRFTTGTVSFNVAGFYALVLFISSVILIRSKSGSLFIGFFCISISLIVLFLGLNKSSIIMLILFLFVYFTDFKLNVKSFIYLCMSFIMISFLSYFFFILLESIFQTSSGVNSISTLTGRTAIWLNLISSINSFPQLLFGSGYGSAEIFFKTSYLFSIDFGHAHNAVLQSVYEVGLIGALLLHLIVFYNIISGAILTGYFGKKNATVNIFFWLNVAVFFRGLTEAGYAQVGSFDSYFLIISYVFFKIMRTNNFYMRILK